MKKIMFGNSLMLLGIALGMGLLYIKIKWAAFLLILVGFIVAVTGLFSENS